MYEPHIVKPSCKKPQHKNLKTRIYCYLRFHDILILFGTLANVILYGSLATTLPFHNFSTLCKRNKKQVDNLLESSKSRMQRLEEPRFDHPCYRT